MRNPSLGFVWHLDPFKAQAFKVSFLNCKGQNLNDGSPNYNTACKQKKVTAFELNTYFYRVNTILCHCSERKTLRNLCTTLSGNSSVKEKTHVPYLYISSATALKNSHNMEISETISSPDREIFETISSLDREISQIISSPNREISQTPTDQRRFSLPVDSENKATEFRIFSLEAPHIRAFHLSWFSFFTCFMSSFAAPPLSPIIRDDLNLNATDIGNARIAAVASAILPRFFMGTACDLFRPRLASASLILGTTIAVYCSAMTDSATSFILVRFFTGFSLGTFVSTQYWMSSMLSAQVVGTANGFAAGWGNIGGGITQIIMPCVSSLVQTIGLTKFAAWRIAFFIPALLQTFSAYAVCLFGQDLPDGNFSQLKKSGDKYKDKVSQIFYHSISNYRAWILALTYGYCFGVELTVDNIIAQYFHDRFDTDIRKAGMIAASFGCANIVSRPGGGYISDLVARRHGMRGRLWTLFVVQIIGGLFCILLGRMESLRASFAVIILFSLFVQAACGLTFGIVPFVSRRSLGAVSGMTAAGGNIGAVLTQFMFFRGSKFKTETGISLMGGMMIVCTLPMLLIWFPQWGGFFWGPSSEGTTEEKYYMSEWSLEEIEKGHHISSPKFAENSRSERGKWANLSLTGSTEAAAHQDMVTEG